MTTHIFSKLNASRRHPNMFAGLNTDGSTPGDVRAISTLGGLADRGMGVRLECGKCRMTGQPGDEAFQALAPEQPLAGLRFSCTRCQSPNVLQMPTSQDSLAGLPVFPLTEVRAVAPRPVAAPPVVEEEHLDEIPEIVPQEEDEDEEEVAAKTADPDEDAIELPPARKAAKGRREAPEVAPAPDQGRKAPAKGRKPAKG